MHYTEHALFQVTVKAIISKGEKILLLTSPDGTFDFPGGRIDEEEANSSLETVLLREISEECGADLKVRVRGIAFAAKRSYVDEGELHRVVALYFDVQYLEGKMTLSDEHNQSEWISPEQLALHPERFASSDEYEHFKAYFSLGTTRSSRQL